MNIVIAGTSNSVMRSGYPAGLVDAGHTITSNRSMGISHSVAIPWMADTLAGADVLILDFSINEQRATRGGMIRIPLIRDALLHARMACEAHGVTPVALTLPIRPWPEPYPIARTYRDLCAELGIPHFDAYAALGPRDGWDGLFRDGHHLHPDIARQVGRSLGDALAGYDRDDRGPASDAAGRPLTFVPVTGETIVRETSIMRVELARLGLWEWRSMPAPPGDVVGVVHNASRSSADLAFVGTGLRKRLDSEFHDPTLELRLVAWQVLDPVPTHGEVRVRAEAPADGAELSDYFRPGLPPRAETVAEVAGIVVRGDAQTFAWRPYRAALG